MRLLILSLLFALSASATTYYVDSDAGNDANAGTSTGAAWRTPPGTRNVGNTAFKNSAWGSITTSAKVQPGDVIKWKRGTTHDSSDGGVIQIDISYYSNATAGSPILIQPDTGWGTGAVTIDGTGITVGIALVLIQRDGVMIDGVATGGFDVRNSTISGMQFKEQAGTGAALLDVGLKYVKFFNNSTAATDDASGNGKFACQFRRANGVTVDHVVVDGDNNWSNGLGFGDSQKDVINATVTDCEAYGLLGTDDGGIGFKAFNSVITFNRILAHNTYKGCDLGEINANGAPINYTVKNSTFYSNNFACNFNCDPAYTSVASFYFFNNLSYNNTERGMVAYDGPYRIYCVHNTMDNNGTGNASSPNYSNITVTPFGSGDQKSIAYLYNNCFYKPGGGTNLTQFRFYDTVDNFELYSDYNSWIQRSSEYFCQWSYLVGPNCLFSYGSNGPGRATGNWYDQYGCDTSSTPLGHFHQDSHSKATGGTDATPPPFTNRGINDYTLTAHYAGLNLSSQPWYVAAMGTDRAGNGRTSWDIGAYEYFTGGGHAPTVSISLPLTSSTYYTTDLIQFTGTASDQEDGTISANIVWSSNLDGTLGTGASITHALSAGTHVITASITDAASNTVTAQVNSLAVIPPAPPAAAARRPGRAPTRVF